MNQNILNEYSIKGTIGKGSFSKVKLGINKLTGQKVAIKILDKKKIKINSERKRIQRELNIIKKLNHINIIKIFQIKEDTNNIYIIMEYIENNLFFYIINNKNLSEKESSFYFFQLISGLEFIHSQGIVHRDLKPENILLTKKRLLKIIDFGLSNYFSKDKLLSTSCGSPSYTAPEILLGKKYDGFASDIWMVGIILFVMVCGNLPFVEKDDKNTLFKNIVKGKVEYPKFISSNVKSLLQKILVVNPEKRININEIKQYQFYQIGKNIFFQNFPEYKNKIEINSNKFDKDNLLKNKKEIPNFDLIRKILKRRKIVKEEKKNNKDNNKNNYKRKNISPLKLLYKLNKEKQIYKNKYLLTDVNEKNNKVIYHKKFIFGDTIIKQSIDYDNSTKHIITKYKNKNSKEKQKVKHIKGRNNKTTIINNDSLNIRTSSEKINLSKYDSIKSNKVINEYTYNNSDISLLNNKKRSVIRKEYKLYDNKYNNSFSNRKTKNYFCVYDNNNYKNKNRKNLSFKNNKPKKNNYSLKQITKMNNMYNSLLYNKPDEKDMNKVFPKYLTIAKERREIKRNYINKSVNKRKINNNYFKKIIFDYKNNSAKNVVGNSKKKLKYNYKKKNKKEDKYNIKEIIKRRGLDSIINKS